MTTQHRQHPPVVLGPNLPETFYRASGRLARFRGADLPPRPEDWVGSATARFGQAPSGLSVLPDGRLLADAIAAEPADWLGPARADAGLLVKLLDAGQRLPVHVHPARPFAQSHLASPYGKTEAWIVLDAAPDAFVHLGFRRDVSAGELARWVQAQDVGALLAATNRIPVAAGDSLLCPAGAPHAIGPDLLLVELQEPTDYSVLLEWEGFDLGPRDATLGLPFELAMQCVDRRAYSTERLAALRGTATSLLPAEAAEFFAAERVAGGQVVTGFAVLVVTDGSGLLTGEWGELALSAGTSLVIPFAAGGCRLSGAVSAVNCRPA
jgi:mannose-6-phosphate isomerase